VADSERSRETLPGLLGDRRQMPDPVLHGEFSRPLGSSQVLHPLEAVARFCKEQPYREEGTKARRMDWRYGRFNMPRKH